MKNLLKKILLGLLIVLSIYALYKLTKLLFSPNLNSGIQYTTKKKIVKLFFVNDEGYLDSEDREIVLGKTVIEDAKSCIYELIKGTKNEKLISTIPPATVLRELYIDDNKCAYVDFNKNLIDAHIGGTVGELNTIYSISNTLITNFDQISSVKILVEGQEVSTISGHIDISKPIKKYEQK